MFMDSLIIFYYFKYFNLKKYLEWFIFIFDVDIFNVNDDNFLIDLVFNCLFKSICCKYYLKVEMVFY